MNLTMNQASLEMMKGNKVSHVLFNIDEYLYIDNYGDMRDENEVLFDDGWKIRKNNTSFEKGWFVIP